MLRSTRAAPSGRQLVGVVSATCEAPTSHTAYIFGRYSGVAS